jgi:hypothetical protein
MALLGPSPLQISRFLDPVSAGATLARDGIARFASSGDIYVAAFLTATRSWRSSRRARRRPVGIANLEGPLAPLLLGERHRDRHALGLQPSQLTLEIVGAEREDGPGHVIVALTT